VTVRLEEEMLVPSVEPRVEQADNRKAPRRDRIDRRDVGALLEVAAQAAEAQVVRLVGAEVLARDDVIHLMRQDRG
jgi:hypothetical protein